VKSNIRVLESVVITTKATLLSLSYFFQSIRPFLMNGLLFANGFNSICIDKAKTDVADEIVRFQTRAQQEELDRIKVGCSGVGG